ncbi:aminotransferase class I/II-fold pyridoxal phosphate-dependent enzyme [Streptomyces parvulus]|uniref:MalY/PatB family protein n=1 Tax=Streptomyces parvulus TaxID=146923 RepID=UPI00332438FD
MSKPLPVAPLSTLRQRRSAKWRMHAPDVIPLSIAEMDFAAAEPITQALRTAVDLSDFGYADGFAELAEAFTDFAAAWWGWHPDPADIVPVTDVGVGTVEILRLLGVRRVLVSTPVYPPFQDWIAEAGAEYVDIPLRQGRLDLDRLADAFRGGGAYLLCNPQNPTGTTHISAELSAVVRLAAQHGVVIVSDEIHAPLALPGAATVPVLSLAGAADHAIALTSASKAWNLAGLKCALVVAQGPRMRSLLKRLPPDTRWRAGHLGVLASTVAFREGRDWLTRLHETLDDRRALFTNLARTELAELDFTPPAATFLAWLAAPPGVSGERLADSVLEHGRVAVEPGEKFGAGGAAHIRVNLATSRELLQAGIAGIRAGVDAL